MRRLWLVFSQTVTVAVALLFVVLTFKPEWLPGGRVPLALPAPTLIQAAPAPAASGALGVAGSFASAAAQAAPAVVSVMATRGVRRGGADPHAGVPGFEEFFGNPSRRQLGLGSGVIVAPQGYLLTNHHVVEGASEIEVQLTDGRSAAATVVGSDPDTDIAVLKIDLPGALPVMRLGDVRALRVGDPVLAIGNPFNVGQTVTSGIVSALDRTGAGSQFQNFIQTDAAINPGNSGGALVDGSGALVGINTAIFSRSGGSMGIGFAVPVDTARSVMEQIIAGGEVRRGWIGVEPREITPELAESLALQARSGVLIAGVLQDGPAARAGVWPGDVLVQVGDRPVRAASDLFAAVAALEPGSTAPMVVQRGRETLRLKVQVGDRNRDARRR
ncbi:MAG: S1C family serine protease [Betaproteobacteria bacterium]